MASDFEGTLKSLKTKVLFCWGPPVTFSGGLKGSNSPPRMCPTMSNHVHPMSNPFGAAGAAYGQKCNFWVKKGHFWAPLGPPGDIFWGPKGFKLTPPDVSNNVQPCLPNVQPIWGCWGCLWPKMSFLGQKRSPLGTSGTPR